MEMGDNVDVSEQIMSSNFIEPYRFEPEIPSDADIAMRINHGNKTGTGVYSPTSLICVSYIYNDSVIHMFHNSHTF